MIVGEEDGFESEQLPVAAGTKDEGASSSGKGTGKRAAAEGELKALPTATKSSGRSASLAAENGLGVEGEKDDNPLGLLLVRRLEFKPRY